MHLSSRPEEEEGCRTLHRETNDEQMFHVKHSLPADDYGKEQRSGAVSSI